MLLNPLHFLSFGFGSGLSPKAPGTFGTLAAVPVFLLVANLQLHYYLAITVVISLAGIYLCSYTSKALKVHDHSGIVIDEIAGFLITMIMVPPELINILLGFVLFRIFDILKPWPISWLDRNLHGGLGIMLDDVVAGLFAAAGLQLYLSLGL